MKGLRIGYGYDVHKLVSDRKLILGGVEIPHDTGLAGHSDADVLLHAITDALLGALALGDIGKHFPDTDPKYKNVDSRILLRDAYELINLKGFELVNLDATIVAQAPKLAPFILTIRERIAEDLNTEIENVSVKATTSEWLGFEGRKEGISSSAVVLLSKSKLMADQIVQNIVDWIDVVPPLGIYLIFFGIAYLENIVPPMPGDVIVAFGGYLAAEGSVSFTVLLIVTVVASVFGFMNMYWFGSKWGSQIEESPDSHFILRFIDYKYFERGKKWMLKWGQWIVFGNRFLAGTRSVISLTTGMSGLKISLTVLNSFLSSLFWNLLLLGAGWYVQDNWEVIGRYLSNYGTFILLIIVALITIRFLTLRSRKNHTQESE